MEGQGISMERMFGHAKTEAPFGSLTPTLIKTGPSSISFEHRDGHMGKGDTYFARRTSEFNPTRGIIGRVLLFLFYKL
jgi:hypothetical protein